MPRSLRIARCTAVLLTGLAWSTGAVSAQAVRGIVVDDGSLARIPGASVRLVIADSLAYGDETNDEGRFFLAVPAEGDYRLEVAGFGYRTARSQAFFIEANDTVDVEFRVLPDAILLDPLTVVGRSERGRNLFERRRTEWGQGIFLTPEQIDSIAPRHPAEVFRDLEDVVMRWESGRFTSGASGPVPSIYTQRGRGCLLYLVNRDPVRPAAWVRGSHWASNQLGKLMPEDVVAVEVYRSALETPPELRRFTHMQRFSSDDESQGTASFESVTNCGVVVIWTRGGW